MKMRHDLLTGWAWAKTIVSTIAMIAVITIAIWALFNGTGIS